MTKHTMMVKGFQAMIFYTETDDPITYSSNGIRHYAHQEGVVVATFVEPEWMQKHPEWGLNQ